MFMGIRTLHFNWTVETLYFNCLGSSRQLSRSIHSPLGLQGASFDVEFGACNYGLTIALLNHYGMSPFSAAGPERNFALEEYGPRSRCFDHTDQMWEERSCHQVRQWQHWGSGCYRFTCGNDGRLHVHVLNQTLTCFYPNQELRVSLSAHGWLHYGALVCPDCESLCGAELAARGLKCRTGMLPPRDYVYPEDVLTCGSPSRFVTSTLLILVAPLAVSWLRSPSWEIVEL